MTIGPILYWILMLLWLIFGIFYPYRQTWATTGAPMIGGSLILFVLLLILGSHVFGIPRL
jgi:low affinity Fe/Cu permease